MPKWVHDLVDRLLDNEHFYPKKSQKERESLAWAIAWTRAKEEDRLADHELHDRDYHAENLLSYAHKLDISGLYKYADALEQRIREILA